MQKKVTASILILLLIVSAGLVFIGCTKSTDTRTKKDSTEKTVLTLGSWRADDLDAWTRLLAEYEKVSGVRIQFKSISPLYPPNYTAELRSQLDNGIGPDLMFARSYTAGEELYEKGFFADINDLPYLQENFSESSREAWRGPTVNPLRFPLPPLCRVSTIIRRFLQGLGSLFLLHGKSCCLPVKS